MIAALRLRLAELRALRLSPVRLCRALRYHGFEHVHDAEDEGRPVLFLLPDLGSVRVGRRVLELFRPGTPVFTVFAAEDEPARHALGTGAAAVWAQARPASPRKHWDVGFLSPVVPRSGDDATTLTRRYLDVLDDAGRRFPELWDVSRT